MGTARLHHLAVSLTALLVAADAAPAWARKNDLNLLNLCGSPECPWVKRRADGWIEGVTLDARAKESFRSLMSELGAVLAPRIPMPADTIGFSGFQVAAELGLTEISRDADYWNGIDGVSPNNPRATRPDAWLTTIGVFLRKGLWLPLPGTEVGAGVVHLLDSQMLAWQAYAKLALHEGYSDWPIPSFAVRGSLAHVTGTDQASMSMASLDLLASRGFGLLKTIRLEPLVGASLVLINARGGPLDATPSCDGHELAAGIPGTDPLPAGCHASQQGTTNDLDAVFSFPRQDAIVRYRLFGGFKLKFGVLSTLVQYEIIPPGQSRDGQEPNGARDQSESQSTLSLSAGFQF